jgi:hypothetical protein
MSVASSPRNTITVCAKMVWHAGNLKELRIPMFLTESSKALQVPSQLPASLAQQLMSASKERSAMRKSA